MILRPRWRKAVLVVHVLTAIGWFGADLVLLTLTASGLAGADPAAVYPAAGLIGTVLFTPLSALVWLVGLVNALGSRWGLLRYWWVVVKLVLTTVMLALVLFLLAPGLRDLAAQPDGREQINMVVAPIVSSSLLVFMTVLSIYKPWGRTGRGSASAAQPAPTGVRKERR